MNIITRKLLIYTFGLLVIIVAFVVGLNSVIGRVQKNITDTKTSKEQQIKLRQKLSILQSPDANFSKSDLVLVAIPANNPALVALSQIRNLAGQTNISITSLAIGQPVKVKSLWKISVSFDADGSKSSVFAFVNALSKSSPVFTFEKFKMTTSGDSARANLVLSYYWSELPKQIPSISETLQFSDQEIQTLNEITSLTTPPQLEEAKPIIRGGNEQKTNPFESSVSDE